MESLFAPDLWILVTLAAAVFQTGRFMLQKHLATDRLSAGGATFSRFFYSAPIVWAVALIILPEWPALGPSFWPYAVAGGLSQIHGLGRVLSTSC